MRETGAGCCPHCSESRAAIALLEQQLADMKVTLGEAYRMADSADAMWRPIGGPPE